MPLKRLAVIALLASASPALADNPYEVAGISNPAHVPQFLNQLKRAMAADNRAAVAAMVQYPLTIILPSGRRKTYSDPASLTADYATVFTPDVVSAVASAQVGNLFVRDQGVMIGQGEIWMNQVGGRMKIITVNHTR